MSPISLLPTTELALLLGVCGGVLLAKPPTPAAAKPGSVPAIIVGLLITVPRAGVAYEACVATEDVELERVGEVGRKEGRGMVCGEALAIGLEGVRRCLDARGVTLALGVARWGELDGAMFTTG